MAEAIDGVADWVLADQYIRKSVELSIQRSERPFLAVTHLRYAEILHKKGDLDRAREQLAEAVALFRDMEMTWWLEQAEGLRARIEAGEPFRGFVPYFDGPPRVV